MRRPLLPRLARTAALVAVTIVAGGCASPLRVLSGEAEKKHLLVRIVAEAGGDTTRATVVVENRFEEPVGLDVDALVVRDGKGRAHKVLGKLQRFRRGDSTVTQRVANGAATVEPSARAELQLEFGPLPDGTPLTLTIPALYRLGIEGQVALKPLEIPLRRDDKATALAGTRAAGDPAGDDFHDPFEE